MSNPDKFNTFMAIDLVPVTPSDTQDLPIQARDIKCIANGGAIRFTALSGEVRNSLIATGGRLECQVIRVHATGTAAGIVLEAMI